MQHKLCSLVIYLSTCNNYFHKHHKLHVNIILLHVYIICLTCRGRCIPPYLCEPKINFKNISKNQFIYLFRVYKTLTKLFKIYLLLTKVIWSQVNKHTALSLKCFDQVLSNWTNTRWRLNEKNRLPQNLREHLQQLHSSCFRSATFQP